MIFFEAYVYRAHRLTLCRYPLMREKFFIYQLLQLITNL